jgi:hypothetical protein
MNSINDSKFQKASDYPKKMLTTPRNKGLSRKNPGELVQKWIPGSKINIFPTVRPAVPFFNFIQSGQGRALVTGILKHILRLPEIMSQEIFVRETSRSIDVIMKPKLEKIIFVIYAHDITVT